jgi:riboflavin synthase
MFNGIVEKTVRVVGVSDGPKFVRLTLPLNFDDLKHGDSVAVNGVCLTVAEIPSPAAVGFDVIKETLDKTNLGMLRPGDDVNVERAMRVGDRVDGHFVQGHVDGTAPLLKQVANDEEWRLTLRAPESLVKYLAPKGSVTVDGVALTIAALHGAEFEVALIPTTVQLTTLIRKPIGWPFNLEADVLSKTIVHYLELRGA